jgi:hypothetical protein
MARTSAHPSKEVPAMTQGLTEWLQQSRMTIVGVDKTNGRVRVRGEADMCSDLSCSAQTLVVTDDGVTADLAALNAGDIVRIEQTAGQPDRIVVVRRVWEELTSPEW